MSLLDKLYNDKTFCDVTFLVEGRQIKAHKCILANESDYFNRMFTSLFREATNSTIPMPDISYDVFSMVVEYIYTKRIDLNPQNFIDIVNVSEMFFLDDLRKRCTEDFKYIFKDIDQFFETLVYIKNISFIKEVCIKYIVELWEKIIYNEKFYELLNDDQEFLKDVLRAVSFKEPHYSNHNVSIEDAKIMKTEMKKSAETIKDPQTVNILLEALEHSNLFSHPDNVRQVYDNCSLPIPLWYNLKYGKYFKHTNDR